MQSRACLMLFSVNFLVQILQLYMPGEFSPTWWEGVMLAHLIRIGADRSKYLEYLQAENKLTTAGELSKLHGGMPPHLVTMYRCLLGRILVPLAFFFSRATAEEQADFQQRVLTAVASFKRAHGFSPNLCFAIESSCGDLLDLPQRTRSRASRLMSTDKSEIKRYLPTS